MSLCSSRTSSWIFCEPAAFLTLALVVMHQSLIASSAYFLTQTITSYQQGAEIGGYLIAYFFSMILPFIPGALSYITTERWINTVHRKFTLTMASTIYGNVNESRSTDSKSAFESAISRNSFSVIAAYILLSHDFLSLALNSVLSLAVIGLILPSEIVFGYCISLILSVGIVYVVSKWVQTLSVDTEKRHADYGNTLGKAWDNAVVGNAYNYGLWLDECQTSGSTYYASSLRLTAYKQLGNIAIAFASLIPTAYLVYQLLVQEKIEAAIIAAIIVNLTRIFHILNALSALIYEVVEWVSASARLRYLLAFLTPACAAELPESPSGSITVNGELITDYSSVREALRDRHRGRLTIRGENGSGKSTLLLSIKQAFSHQAHLLPAGNNQLCWRFRRADMSTGQRSLAILDELLRQGGDIRYLLLDEWDANLDQDNRDHIDESLERLSQDKVVVEVRH